MTFLTGRLLPLVSFVRSWITRERGAGLSVETPKSIRGVVYEAQRVRRLRLRWAYTDDRGGASSSIYGFLFPRFLILLPRDLLQCEREAELRVVIAHELGHCILRHHVVERWLRLLGLILLLDPVLPTAFMRHCKNEEDADRVGVRILGNTKRAVDEFSRCLEAHQARETEWTVHDVGEPNALDYSQSCRATLRYATPKRPQRMIRDAVQEFLNYMMSRRILYIHPSIPTRLRYLAEIRASLGSDESSAG